MSQEEAIKLLEHALLAPGRPNTHDPNKHPGEGDRCFWCAECSDVVLKAYHMLGGKHPELD